MNFTKRIRTVLYDDQKFSSAELELLHTPAFQRLYDLHQLGWTDRVFIDASHSRLHHVVGVVEQATNLMRALENNLTSKPNVHLPYTDSPSETHAPTAGEFAKLVKERIPAARLMALLHDLTHAPYGHTLEDEIGLVAEKHDDPKRQADAFYRVVIQFFGWMSKNTAQNIFAEIPNYTILHNKLSNYLRWPDLLQPPTDKEFVSFIASLATVIIRTADERRKEQPFLRLDSRELVVFTKNLAFATRSLLYLESAHKKKIQQNQIPGSYPIDAFFSSLFDSLNVTLTNSELFIPHRDAFMLDVIGNTICADLLDYAKRDSVNAGLKLDYDASRIIQNFTLISHSLDNPSVLNAEPHVIAHPFRHTSIRTAISLYGSKLRMDVPGELLNLLQVRYYVYERMLYHPTKCVAGAMLGVAIQLIGWKDLPHHFRFLGDSVFISDTRSAVKLFLELLEAHRGEHAFYSSELATTLASCLNSIPETRVTLAVRDLIASRVVRLSNIKARLKQFCNFRRFKNSPMRLLSLLSDLGNDDNDEFSDVIVQHIFERVSQNRLPELSKEDVESLITELLPSVDHVLSEISAGLDLLTRLNARQFYKPIFRLLPNAHSHANTGITVDTLATKFLDPVTRWVAEREIERRSRLPIGTVVIHCPKADGPKKIAQILITPGTDEIQNTPQRAVPLYKIGALHEPIFKQHQDAISALQDMYSSMWKLLVSVSPTHVSDWNTICKEAGVVIHEILREGDTILDPVLNDEYMQMEIAASLRAGAATDSGATSPNTERAENQSSPASSLFQHLTSLLAKSASFKALLARQNELQSEGSEAFLMKELQLVLEKEIVAHSRVEPSAPTSPSTSPFSGDVVIISLCDRVLSPYLQTMDATQKQRLESLLPAFVQEAISTPEKRQRVINRLQSYSDALRLLPGETIQHNSAKASFIVADLYSTIE